MSKVIVLFILSSAFTLMGSIFRLEGITNSKAFLIVGIILWIATAVLFVKEFSAQKKEN